MHPVTVHEVATAGFGAEAAAYEAARPSYPPGVVSWLAEHLRIRPGRTVVDLAAGTGKLTRLLTPLGAEVVAVEPVAGMRSAFCAAVPGTPLVGAPAEALPFADGSLDAVTVAQAFHWFDQDAAHAELRRTLRPGGRYGLVWNARDRRDDWVEQVWSVMDRVEKAAPWQAHDEWRDSALGERPGFGPLHEATFRHHHEVTPDEVVLRIASVSHVAVLPEAERAAVLDEVRDILGAHPDTRGQTTVALPYRVDAYWAERID